LPVLDSGEAGSLLWYPMPYVEGESLRDRLRREVQLPVEDAVRLTSEVAEAGRRFHSSGMPGNRSPCSRQSRATLSGWK
jgi:serine/threonine-protein kinase